MLNNPNSKETDDAVINTGTAIVGALVGMAVGGPTGAVVGAASSPLLNSVIRLTDRALERRRARAQQVMEDALKSQGIDSSRAIDTLSKDDEITDAIIDLLTQAVSSDKGVESIFSALIGNLLTSESDIHRERVLIIADALRGIRNIHMRILLSLDASGGEQSARELATIVQIPEVELRSVVRDLELRGMIKDVGVHPVRWKIRELGSAIIKYSTEAIANHT